MEDISKKAPIYSPFDLQLTLDNITIIEHAYKFEKEYMFAVQQGDVDKVSELFDEAYFNQPSAHLFKRLPQDPLRQMRNMLIVNNTLCRTAAKKGGLPVVYLHTVSEKFAHIIETVNSFEYAADLSKALAVEYARAVSMFSTLNYSDIIKEAVRYLTSNITKDISLTQLAAQLGVNPSYLSRTFREDTGMSLVDYINHQRIELSKYYFESASDHVTEVAFKSGYNDSSYFAKTFKKITGITPKEYIRNCKTRC